ncbi:MAG: polysaccharide biosynthesis C-terminal domain-containing protein, partial [Candidatus Woesearchaeota archaeon]
ALVFFFFNFNLVKAAMSILIAYVFVFSVIFYTIYRRINFLKEETNTNLTKQIFNFSWPIMLSSVLYLLLHRIDIFFIGHFLDSSIVGKYSVSSDLSNVLGILNAIIIPIFFPVISKLVSGDKIKEAGTIFRKTTKFLTIFTLPLLLVFLLFNNEIIFYIFGKEYAGSGIFLAILSFASFFACISGPIGMLLKAMNYPKLVLLNSIVALLINLVLNYLLITKFGAVGVAIATLVSIFTQNYLGILELWLIKKIKPYDFNLIRPVIMIMLIGICGFLIKNNLPPTIFYNMLVAGGIISLYGIYLLIDKKLINIKFYIQLAQGMMKNGKQK